MNFKRNLAAVFWVGIAFVLFGRAAKNFVTEDLVMRVDATLAAILGLVLLNLAYKLAKNKITTKWFGYVASALVGSMAASYTVAFLIIFFKYQSAISLLYASGTALIVYSCVETFVLIKRSVTNVSKKPTLTNF